MNEDEFRQRHELDTPALDAWGALVVSTISSELSKKFGQKAYEEWVKIPPSYRVKKPCSFIAKAFTLNRGWFSCYEDIKDKVGARFVLGLSQQIKIVSDIVLAIDIWDAVPSREFDHWKDSDPRLFDYQSAHFHLESLEDIVINDVTIPSGTVCELQIRTLLQHAYAELSHDTLYKSNIKNHPETHRLFAKSMALMETTDDMLARAQEASQKGIKFVTTWREEIYTYTKLKFPNAKFDYSIREDEFTIDSLHDLLKRIKPREMSNFYDSEENQYLAERIISARSIHRSFCLSSIIAVYFLAQRYPRTFPKHSTLDFKILTKIYTDLGISPPWQTS